MILSFKTKFPDGTPTDFAAKILGGEKIHSLREDEHNRWQAGRYIHMATGVRSKNYHQFNKGIPSLENCISTQKVDMSYRFGFLQIKIDGKFYIEGETIDTLIKNDGLIKIQFLDWFFPKNVKEWSGTIIHWTDFVY